MLLLLLSAWVRSRLYTYDAWLDEWFAWLAANFSRLVAWTWLTWLLNAEVNNVSWWLDHSDSLDNIWWWSWQSSVNIGNSWWTIGRNSDDLTSQHWSLDSGQAGDDLLDLLIQLRVVDIDLSWI